VLRDNLIAGIIIYKYFGLRNGDVIKVRILRIFMNPFTIGIPGYIIYIVVNKTSFMATNPTIFAYSPLINISKQ